MTDFGQKRLRRLESTLPGPHSIYRSIVWDPNHCNVFTHCTGEVICSIMRARMESAPSWGSPVTFATTGTVGSQNARDSSTLASCFCRRTHQSRMVCTGDIQRNGAAGTGFRCAFSCGFHIGARARQHDVFRAVDVRNFGPRSFAKSPEGLRT